MLEEIRWVSASAVSIPTQEHPPEHHSTFVGLENDSLEILRDNELLSSYSGNEQL